VDVILAALRRSWAVHRGPTHSLAFVVLGSLSFFPLSFWLRTTKLKSFLFALTCLSGHLFSDWIGNAGIPLWWPLGSSKKTKQALGVMTGKKKKRRKIFCF
jgi:membrane-bound metal-dependent hydrolase YbcI (DUF457 family)